jgi:hypothetical protein
LATRTAYNRVKGALFESQVGHLLKKSGYELVRPDGISVKEGSLRGRGGWHQIDAFGFYSYGVPCLYPIRIICEAKNYAGKAGLPVVRNFVGAFKDIAENYFVETLGASADHLLTKRYTDAGAIFSARGFTIQAQDYAYAQGVFLVSYEDNYVLAPLLDISDSLLDSISIANAAEDIHRFRTWISKKTENPSRTFEYDQTFMSRGFEEIFGKYVESVHRMKTSYLATASGIYPVHVLSENEIPWSLFDGTDEANCRIYYREGSENCLEIIPEAARQFKFYISVPREMIANYRDRERMLDFKAKFFHYIDLPVLQNEKRRMLRFRLNTEWIDNLRRRRPRFTS